MSVTPKDFLDSATTLAGSGCDEMMKRNVLSRAYYAAYHRSCEFIKPEDTDENVGVHKRYVNQLMRGDSGSIERKIGGRIRSMYSRRRTAGYQLNSNIEKDAAALQLAIARELFSIIEAAEKGNSSSNGNLSIATCAHLKIVK